MASILQFDPASSAARRPERPAPGPDALRALQLASTLQVWLDPGRVIQRFAADLLEHGEADGIAYRDPEEDRTLLHGTRAAHRVAYRLVVDDEDLGEVTLMCRRRYEPAELEGIETLLAALVYPLRNALRFRRLERCARLDALTGAGNRAALDEELRRQMDLARRGGHSLGLLMLDLDHFKEINDRLGHAAGDEVLRECAARIRGAMRRSDLLFRYGGEEFVILLPDAGCEAAVALAERIRRAVSARPFRLREETVRVTVSVGIACHRPGEPQAALLERADRALYAAKRAGRNRVEVHPPAGA
ncbi:GGDEF domain-containing protein [Inmirania thermothiophila]|uniref:diguanylate cyclase n=1 Tax=Inmirania thermothiophila TaxID=1750597 RepID=A0A3N1Y0C8_9GAMM|nr:GGDEF domain-containing protein [Inmirania thermothiophila]ROR32266.1 diguanylate cyclase (GGDEF)-like protein [Inmirania thermothiophila]